MKNDRIHNLENIMTELSDKFLMMVKGLTIEGFDLDRELLKEDHPGFSLFTPEDSAFYRSKYQEGYLEWLIRNILVKEAFDYLFKSYNYDIRWNNCIIGFRNEEREQFDPVEFFIVNNDHAKAYRYTPIDRDYSISLNIPHSANFEITCQVNGIQKIDQWVVIDWSNNFSPPKDHYSPFQITITLRDLFKDYFSIDEYKVFIVFAKDMVFQAHKMLGFQTISHLALSNLFIYKTALLDKIVNTHFDEMHYMLVNSQGAVSTDTKTEKIDDADAAIIKNNFINNSRYLSLTGVKAFANSFITSEYLFQTFNPDQAFDYTAVIAGYIKAVEQLCACIIYEILLPQNNPKLLAMARSFTKHEQTLKEELYAAGTLKKINKYDYVIVAESNTQYYNKKLSLESLIYFFDINKSILLEIDQKHSWPIIMRCIFNYVSFDRNGYFHKHNINDFSVVERIRNNTLLIIYWLLGGIKLTGNVEKDCHLLGVVDGAFDRLIRKTILRKSIYRFVFVFENGVEHKMIRLQIPHGSIKYDKNGYIDESIQLAFLEVEEYPSPQQYYQLSTKNIPLDKIVYVNRKTMPQEVYLINIDDLKIRI